MVANTPKENILCTFISRKSRSCVASASAVSLLPSSGIISLRPSPLTSLPTSEVHPRTAGALECASPLHELELQWHCLLNFVHWSPWDKQLLLRCLLAQCWTKLLEPHPQSRSGPGCCPGPLPFSVFKKHPGCARETVSSRTEARRCWAIEYRKQFVSATGVNNMEYVVII